MLLPLLQAQVFSGVEVPAIGKLGAIFTLMLVLLRFRIQIGWTLCIGAVLTGFWFSQSGPIATVVDIGGYILAAFGSGRNIVLVSLIMFVLVLNHTLRASGQINRIVDAFFNICRRPRTTLLFFPALLGLLPMPGGALFSAPMVEAVGKPMEVTAREKTLINYWFRHIWEYCWPLYPGIILTAQLTGYSIAIIVVAQLPLMLVCLLVGFFFFLRHIKGRNVKVCPPEQASLGNPWGRFLAEVMPIILVIVLYAVLEVVNKLLLGDLAGGSPLHLAESGGVHGFLAWLPKNSMLVVSVTVAIVFTWLSNRMSLSAIGHVFWQKDMVNNLIIALGIIVFAGVLEGSGAAGSVSGELERSVVPTWVVAIVLPFIVGAVTGITMNMVILTYPILLKILATQGDDTLALGYCCLAFAAGYGAILITPLHICMLQSNEFFGLGPISTIRRLVAPTALVMVAGGGLFLFYNWLLPAMGWLHKLPQVAGGQ